MSIFALFNLISVKKYFYPKFFKKWPINYEFNNLIPLENSSSEKTNASPIFKILTVAELSISLYKKLKTAEFFS